MTGRRDAKRFDHAGVTSAIKRGMRRRERRAIRPVYDPADDMRVSDHVQYAEDWDREDFLGEYPWDEENLCDDHP